MSKADEAMACKGQGYCCSQAVLSAFAEDLGLDKATSLKIAGGFGGGMARTGDTCGAVTGGLMVVGLKHGCEDGDDAAAKAKTGEVARDLLDRFKAQYGTVLCRELIGCAIDTPERMKAAKDSGVLDATCPDLIRSTCDALEELL